MHDVDPRKSDAKGLSTKEKLFILSVLILLGMMALLYKNYHTLEIHLRGHSKTSSVGGKATTARSAPSGGSSQPIEVPRIDISRITGRLYSDGYFRYNGKVGNIGNGTASNLVLSVEIFDTQNSKLVGRDTQLYPVLPPAAWELVRGTMAVPQQTKKVRMKVDVENYPIAVKHDSKTDKKPAAN